MPLYPNVMVPLQIDRAIGVGRYRLDSSTNTGGRRRSTLRLPQVNE